jgi:hypothetical protein
VTCWHYVQSIDFRDHKAKAECEQLALYIDAYERMEVGGVPLPVESELLDLMCRRLLGVMQSDLTGNWSFASATQKSGANRAVGSALFAVMSKAATAYDKTVKAARGGEKSSRRGVRGSGRSTRPLPAAAPTATAAAPASAGPTVQYRRDRPPRR